MAEHSESKLTVDWLGIQTDLVDVSDWANGKDNSNCTQFPLDLWQMILCRIGIGQSVTRSELNLETDRQKRANIVHAIIHNHSVNHLERILQSGWDVNETLRMPDYFQTDRDGLLYPFGTERAEQDNYNTSTLMIDYIQRTALGEAAKRGWTEGVKMLLDAGAKCVAPHPSQYPLRLALWNHRYPTDIIELLLQHGADPNYHDDSNIPLTEAIQNCTSTRVVRHVQVLLEHGADPNVVSQHSKDFTSCPLSQALKKEQFPDLYKMLIEFAVDVNKAWPSICCNLPHMFRNSSLGFIKKQLDMFFQHGGNINMEYHHQTLLERAVEKQSNSNNIRWLIRHGADVTRIPLSMAIDIRTWIGCFPDTPLILLQAGVKLSHGVVRQLQHMEISIHLHYKSDRHPFAHALEDMQGQLRYEDWRQFNVMQCHARKITFPEHLTPQMTDLQEFSDENLDVYPEVGYIEWNQKREKWQMILDMVHMLVEFPSQTQSLQWSCRRCLRENLVSLQPSVVKSLPIPARLKRYILCHEI